MIIKLPEWDGWRIAGSGIDWQVQKFIKRKDGEQWQATNYYMSLDSALAAAFERTLRESNEKAETVREMKKECKRVKDALLREVRKVEA